MAAEGEQERAVQVVTQVRLTGVPLLMVEDTETDDEHGASQSVRRWATSAADDVVVSTLTMQVSDRTHVAELVRDETAGAVLLRGMRRGEARTQLQEAVRAARDVQPREAAEVLHLDGTPVPGVVAVASGVRVVGAVTGRTLLVVTADEPVDVSLGDSGDGLR